jgi:hypothetical protein
MLRGLRKAFPRKPDQLGRGVSAFPVGLLGEPLPGLRHFLHDFAMPLGLGLSRQTVAFLRKSPIFR